MPYEDPNLVVDEVATAEAMLAGMAEQVPGLEPRDGHALTPLAESAAVAVATALQLLRDELADAYAGVGDVLGVQRVAAAPAEATSTWLFAGTAPAIIAGGTTVRGTTPAGDTVEFAVLRDTTAGAASVSGVPLVAVEAGPQTNGVSGTGETDEVAGVTITFDQESSGGTDEEGAVGFRDRIEDRSRRMRALPITPSDHAAFALDVPGVGRAYAVNRYDPATPLADAPGHVTVFGVSPGGGEMGPATLAAAVAYFAAIEKVLNAVVHVVEIPRVDVTVRVDVRAMPDTSVEDLRARVRAAITDALEPDRFIADDRRPGLFRPPPPSVTQYHVDQALAGMEGLRSVELVLVNNGATVALPAPVGLPRLAAEPTVNVS